MPTIVLIKIKGYQPFFNSRVQENHIYKNQTLHGSFRKTVILRESLINLFAFLKMFLNPS